MPKADYPDVLALRYASPEMVQLWAPVQKTIMERQFWIAVMKAQAELGIDIPAEAIVAYEAVVQQVDLDSIEARERQTKHDVKAKIEEFNALATFEYNYQRDQSGAFARQLEYCHMGLTSRDLTENVEQMQILRSLLLIRDRMVAVLGTLARRAVEYEELVIAGRSHNVAAQPILLGKRFANTGDTMLGIFESMERLIATYPLRGIKGPMGTSQDQLELFGGDAGKVQQLEVKVMEFLGFDELLGSVGQVYPRSLDQRVVGLLDELAAPAASLATTIRLMAGQELATEGFKPGQVGSSAMPHKMNARTCERICGFKKIMTGYLAMASALSGDQWNEGDVSCSVVRRVLLPDSFFTIDGLLQAFLTVLRDFGAYPAVIEAELDRYLPFLSTTKILMSLVQEGVGREAGHEAIKEHAVKAALVMREQGESKNDLIDRLEADSRIVVGREVMEAALADPFSLTGLASDQITVFCKKIARIERVYPEAAAYVPGSIL